MTNPREPPASKVAAWLKALEPCLERLDNVDIDTAALGGLVAGVFGVVQPRRKPDDSELTAAVSTLGHLVGKRHTKAMLTRNVTRLLANWHFIRCGMAVPVWNGDPITVSMLVLGVRRMLMVDGRSGYLLLVKLKTGLAAGIIKCMVLSDNAVDAFMDHKAGVSKYQCAREEISGMEARAVVSIRFDDTLKAHEFDTTDSMRKHNRDLADRRSNPRKCSSGMSCNACRKNIKECPLAVWLPEDARKE